MEPRPQGKPPLRQPLRRRLAVHVLHLKGEDAALAKRFRCREDPKPGVLPQELRRQTEEKSALESRELAETLQGRQAQLRAQAEPMLKEAAALIVERIVND